MPTKKSPFLKNFNIIVAIISYLAVSGQEKFIEDLPVLQRSGQGTKEKAKAEALTFLSCQKFAV